MRKALMAALAGASLLAAPAAAQIDTAKVTGGTVQGTAKDGIGIFKGIPFAAPPVGKLRWNVPQPVAPWSGVKTTTEFGPACMQAAAMLQMTGASAKPSEDCLYLNVWTPAKSAGEKLPVMVWIYGGAFAAGTTSSPAFDGTQLAKRGVVLVSVAYRVGTLGWLAHKELSREQGGTSGNYGLYDQIAGLKWVQENIAKFGGDPTNVTIFGESAGGISIGMLAVSPLAKGLYAKAISESGGNFAVPSTNEGPGQGTRTLTAAEVQGAATLAGLGASTIVEAREIPAETILAKATGSNWPIYDGKLLPDDPWLLYDAGRFNDTPVLIGTNSDEGGLFIRQPVQPETFEKNIRAQYGSFADRVLALYPHATPEQARQAQADMMRETAFAWPTFSWARKQTAHGKAPAYVYYYDHRTPQTPNGAGHASEIQYVFGNLGTIQGAPPSDSDQALRDQFMGYWINFAKTGDPNGPGLAKWPVFAPGKDTIMGLGDKVGPMGVPFPEQYRFFDDYFAAQRTTAPR